MFALPKPYMEPIKLKDKTFRPYIKAHVINEAVSSIAKRINQDMENKFPLFLVVLNGSFMFASDLLKEITVQSEISFIKLTSYKGTTSDGSTTELIGLKEEVKNRPVIVIEDIVDTGVTIETIYQLLETKGAKEIKIASLLFKPDAYKKNISIDYVGIKIPNDFVVGYGLDYDGLGRNLKELYVVVDD